MKKDNETITKKCKHCRSEIDKKAKVCPICKKEQGSALLKDFITRLIAAILLVGLVYGGIKFVSYVMKQDVKEEIYEMNERIEFEDSAITVLGYKTKERESDIWSAGEGNEFYIITIKFENTSTSTKSFYSIDFSLIDTNGVYYDREDFIKHEEMGSLKLEKNGTATKDIRFAIPKGMEKVTLKYDNGLFGKTVKIKIK